MFNSNFTVGELSLVNGRVYTILIRYPNVDINAFRDAWDKLSTRVIEFFKTHYGVDFQCSWSHDIAEFLVLLKMLPAKAAGAKISVIESSYKKAEQNLIVFRKVMNESCIESCDSLQTIIFTH